MRAFATRELYYCKRATDERLPWPPVLTSFTHHEPQRSCRSHSRLHWQPHARSQMTVPLQRQQLPALVLTCSSCERCPPACPLAYLSAPCSPACPRASRWPMGHCSTVLAGRAPVMTAGCPPSRLRWELGRRRHWHLRLWWPSRSGLFHSHVREETVDPWVQVSQRLRRMHCQKFWEVGRERRGEKAGQWWRLRGHPRVLRVLWLRVVE